MKRIFLALSFVTTVSATSAQVNTAIHPFPKTIQVTGSAEMEVVPDEIFVQVDLREYEKKGAGKIAIEIIKKKFLEACIAAGIAEADISVTSYQGFDRQYWLNKKKKNPDMMAGISYIIKFASTAKIDALVEKLDDEATQGFFITNTSHSKIEEFRRQLKIQAVKAAKEKAIYLSEAIGEKAGVAVTIQEPVDHSVVPVFKNLAASNVMLRGLEAYDNSQSEPSVDFKKIKLKFEVSAVFALQ
ncbi:MAG: SIMPL domain-containing protein [Chitinophagaceae bacterium]|nr:SIMPL domain-containing protein [Chitinophagaceae bacterium]